MHLYLDLEDGVESCEQGKARSLAWQQCWIQGKYTEQKECRVIPELRKSKSSSMFELNIGSRSAKFLSVVLLTASAMAGFSNHSCSFGDLTV